MPATGQKTAPIAAQRSSIKILYAESDEKALATQTAEMTKVGHHVTTAVGRRAVQDALRALPLTS